MTEQLEKFMTEELGIIDRLGFEPLEGEELFLDVGNNVWNLDQIIHAFNNQWALKEYHTHHLTAPLLWARRVAILISLSIELKKNGTKHIPPRKPYRMPTLHWQKPKKNTKKSWLYSETQLNYKYDSN